MDNVNTILQSIISFFIAVLFSYLFYYNKLSSFNTYLGIINLFIPTLIKRVDF